MAVTIEFLDQVVACLRIDEARRLEGLHQRVGRIRRVAENRLEMRIGGECGGADRTEGADVDTLVNGFEQSCER